MSGTVKDSNNSIDCHSDCIKTLVSNTSVHLEAIPDDGFVFSNWEDLTTNPIRNIFTMTQNTTVRASFKSSSLILTININIPNAGTIIDAVNSINTSVSITKTLATGTEVNLTATPNSGYTFSNWEDNSSALIRPQFILTTTKSVTATFISSTIQTYVLTININIPNAGTIIDADNSINTSVSITKTLATGTEVNLTATPNSGYNFLHWEDNSSALIRSQFILTTTKSVTATFISSTIQTYVLTITIIGSGTIIDSVNSINASVSITKTLDSGTAVNLTAVPESGYNFSHWEDTSPALIRPQFILNGDKTVTATFTASTSVIRNLTVNIIGSGTVTDAVNSIIISTSMTIQLFIGTEINLTAVPSSGYGFSHWEDNITTVNKPKFLFIDDKTVTATFTVLPVQTYNLTIIITVPNAGVITNSLNNINVSVTTVIPLNVGTQVELNQTENPGYFFYKWDDGSIISSYPPFTMNSDMEVIATYISLIEICGKYFSGGYGTYPYDFILPSGVTQIIITIDNVRIPDRLTVTGGGSLDTTFISGGGTGPYIVDITNPNITITVYGVDVDTIWGYTVDCIY